MKYIPGRVFSLVTVFFLTACIGVSNQTSKTIYEYDGERYEISASIEGGSNVVALSKLVGGYPIFIGSYDLDANGQVRREDEAINRRISLIIEDGREISTSSGPVGIGGGE